MSSVREFSRYAEQCSRMAQEDPTGNYHEELLNMAREWRRLAAEEARIDELVRAVEALIPVPAAAPVSSRKRLRGLIPRLQDSLFFKQWSLH